MSEPKKFIYKYDSTLNFSDSLEYDNQKHLVYSREAAECHKHIRTELRKFLKPNLKLTDICKFIENGITQKFGKNNKEAGVAFPIGISINNVVAHDSALPNDTRILKKNDIVKIDIGTHVNGIIVDSAFSYAFDDKYNKLIEATKDATWSAIKMAGPDVIIEEMSKVIQEVIESYEITLNGKTHRINAVSGLGGHNIKPYVIHGGKLILCKPEYDNTLKNQRMESGEYFAIETFASTGSGQLKHGKTDISHFGLNLNMDAQPKLILDCSKKVYHWIKNNRNTLPFCSRWVADGTNPILGEKYKMGLNELVKKNVVIGYPVLEDVMGTYTSQTEHTLYLHDKGKEILSANDDY